MRRLFALEDWVVAALAPTERWRGRAAVRFSFGLSPWGIAFAVAFLVLGEWTLAASLGAAGIGVGLVPVVLRLTRSASLAGHWLTAFLVQSLVIPAWMLGGLQAACFPWLAACIVAATILSGRWAGVAWGVFAGALTLGLFAAHWTGLLPAPSVPQEVIWALAAGAHCGLFAVTLAMVLAAADVTARARAELEHARVAAVDANRAKSEFLDRMSHELRTPLTAIIGYAELVAEENAAARADAERIQAAGEHLLSIINDVLDLAKVEAGRMEFQVRVVDLREIVHDVTGACANLARLRANRLVVHVDGDAVALADDLRLRQCLLNLVGNAAKFTSGGEIRVAVRDDGDRTLLEVSDTGIGMTAGQLARAFEPFQQGSEEIGRTHGGTGLGLAIVQQFAERMGGHVHAKSAFGQGTAFVLDLPRPSLSERAVATAR